MKKHLLFLLSVGISAFFTTSVSAACQDIHFSNGEKFCFDIQKISSERFQAKTSASNLSNSSDLSCRLQLPDGNTVALPRCEGEFSYKGNNGKIILKADLPNYWYELIANYDFQNGSFGGSNSVSNSNIYYQPEIIAVSNDKPAKDQRVDVTVRLKNNYSFSYNNGTINFRVEHYKNGRRENASSYDYDLERTSYSFSSYDNGEKKFDRLVRFRTEGEFRLYIDSNGGGSTYKTFSVGSTISTHTNYTPEWTAISDTTPNQNQRIDMTLKIKKDNYYSSNYNGSVDFRVEQYRNGIRESASSYDYQLDKTSYYFSSSDQGEVRLRSFVKFMNRGEFRVIAQLRGNGNSSAHQTFTVGGNSNSYPNSYYNVDSLSIRSFYPSSPRVNEWIDITVRAVDRYGNKVNNYDSRIRFEVEEYRNGYRRSAHYSSFELDQYSYDFSRYDNGEKTFNDVIRFKTEGEFRIKVIDDNQSSIYGTKEITVRYSNSNNYRNNNSYSNFTEKELSKIRAVVGIWNEVIIALEKDYPRLRNSYEWKRVSNDFYANMQDILRNPNNAKLKDRKEFYAAFQEWFSLTIRIR